MLVSMERCEVAIMAYLISDFFMHRDLLGPDLFQVFVLC
jgi:hypothetical protein